MPAMQADAATLDGVLKYVPPEAPDPRGRWHARVAPHLAGRLKRIFPRAEAGRPGVVELVDTPEVCRDLDWFLLRHPLRLDPADARRLKASARRHAGQARRMEAVLLGGDAPQPAGLALPLRPYQAAAVALAREAGGLLLADDVGLGKTATAIGLLCDAAARPAAVVTLPHLLRQWAAELARFAPDLRVHVARTGKPEELERYPSGSRPDVVVLNYHKLAGWAPALTGRVRGVVFDEVQELRRGPESAKYRAAAGVSGSATLRLGLSATPIYNYGGEIYHVLEALRPGALGSPAEFVREWCPGSFGDRPRLRNPEAFGAHARAEGLMLRRTRAEVGRELPVLSVVPYAAEADLQPLEDVASAACELARIILAQGGLGRGDRLRASEELSWRLRQATGIAKARFVAAFTRLLVDSGEAVVLFGWHREVYALWGEALKDLEPAWVTGAESPGEKERQIARFASGRTPVLIMSLRAGAGVDGLQAASRTAVFGELDWSPGVHEQCVGRLHRDGQAEPVVAYYLLADAGSDPVVADALGLKRRQVEALRDPGLPAVGAAPLGAAGDVAAGHVRRLAEAVLAQRGGGAR